VKIKIHIKSTFILIILISLSFICTQTITLVILLDRGAKTITSGNTIINSAFAKSSGTDLSIDRIVLYFENRRPEITIQRNYPDLKAFADIKFQGTGLIQGHWEVDGRILSYINQPLTFKGAVTLKTEIPPLPTFDTGTHVVRLVITNPEDEVPLPSILYFVTSGEFKGIPVALKLLSPEEKALLDYAPIKFEWEKFDTKIMYLIQFYEDPESKPIFSTCVSVPSYTLTERVLKRIFTAGQKYYWKVKGCGGEERTGESKMRVFTFKKLRSNADGRFSESRRGK
jgi:hypothetical protein